MKRMTANLHLHLCILLYRMPQEILNGIHKYAFLWPPPTPAGPVKRGVHVLKNEYVDLEASRDLGRAVFVPRNLVERTGCGSLNVTFDEFISQKDFCNTPVGKLKFGCCARQSFLLRVWYVVVVIVTACVPRKCCSAVCVCVRACVRACVHACVCVRVCIHAFYCLTLCQMQGVVWVCHCSL